MQELFSLRNGRPSLIWSNFTTETHTTTTTFGDHDSTLFLFSYLLLLFFCFVADYWFSAIARLSVCLSFFLSFFGLNYYALSSFEGLVFQAPVPVSNLGVTFGIRCWLDLCCSFSQCLLYFVLAKFVVFWSRIFFFYTCSVFVLLFLWDWVLLLRRKLLAASIASMGYSSLALCNASQKRCALWYIYFTSPSTRH